MSAITDRTQEALDRISARFLELGVLPIGATPEGWAQEQHFPDPGEGHRRYGWIPPFEAPEAGPHRRACRCGSCLKGDRPSLTVHGAFCPERIVEQSRHLDDIHFAAYLGAVFLTMLHHLIFMAVPWQLREALVDDALYEQYPAALRLLSEVQLRPLDDVV